MLILWKDIASTVWSIRLNHFYIGHSINLPFVLPWIHLWQLLDLLKKFVHVPVDGINFASRHRLSTLRPKILPIQLPHCTSEPLSPALRLGLKAVRHSRMHPC